MKVSVRLFAVLRERAGSNIVEVELPDGATVREAIAALPVAQGVPVVMAVNREVAAEDVVLRPDDELALIPPVSGGAIHTDPLSVEALVERVRDPRAGAVVTFSGVTREVDFLDYEAYAEMAAEQIEVIVTDAIERHGLCKAAADHRIGRVELGEPSVVVAASAPHRDAAFAGAREIIDEIKARVPIWKREEGEWIHPA
jgi:molybdopterin synthase catalytic subunit/molybdopterin converting factor small subunit